MRTANVVEEMFAKFQAGFTDIFPPESKPIEYQEELMKRRKERTRGG
jgi:tRNA U34 5-methylaminomethyl-2-thiouridine-forming methyltransferase MnmC